MICYIGIQEIYKIDDVMMIILGIPVVTSVTRSGLIRGRPPTLGLSPFALFPHSRYNHNLTHPILIIPSESSNTMITIEILTIRKTVS